MAKRAGQRAADLAGNTQSARAGYVRDVNRFKLNARCRPYQPFAGTIFGDQALEHFGPIQSMGALKLTTQLLANIGHHIKVLRAKKIQPAPNLLRPHLGFLGVHAQRDHSLAHLVEREANERCFNRGNVSRVGIW